MKASELMIGDWVDDGGENARVTSLTCDGIIETTRRISNIEVVEPIHLTSEILEKNGFTCCNEDDDGSIQYEFGTDDLGVDVWLNTPDGICLLGAWRRWENCDKVYTMIEELPIRFIHELQHALKLCGIDKEIVL